MTIRMFVFGLLTVLAVGCAKSSDHGSRSNQYDDNRGGDSFPQEDGQIHIISHTGGVIAGARILIGPRENVPFAGNLLTADETGTIKLPSAWTSNQPVTIDAPGFLRATYFNVEPHGQTFAVRPVSPALRLQVSGQATGFGSLERDGFVDVGLVFPEVRRADLINFDASSIVSPESDKIKVLGQSAEIPSNLVLPKQVETYVLPITLNKPSYRAFVPQVGPTRIATVHARFPIKSTVDDIRAGRSILGVINRFEFIGAGDRELNITASGTSADFDVSAIPFDTKLEITAPQYAAGYSMLAMAMVERSGRVFPSDIKSIAPGAKGRLSHPTQAAATGSIYTILKKSGGEGDELGKSIDEFSATIIPTNRSQTIEFMPIIKAPEVRDNVVIMQTPASSASIRKVATYAILSKVVTREGPVAVDVKLPIWELYASEWQEQMSMPEFPQSGTPPPGEKRRLEVLYLGDDSRETSLPPMGPGLLESTTHVSKNFLDL